MARVRPWWRRVRALQRLQYRELFEATGSLYGSGRDDIEAEAIRAELREKGVPVDPVLTEEPSVLEEIYWDGGDTDERYQRYQRELHAANDIHHPPGPSRGRVSRNR